MSKYVLLFDYFFTYSGVYEILKEVGDSYNVKFLYHMKNIYQSTGFTTKRYYNLIKEDELLISYLIPKNERSVRKLFDEFNPDMIVKEHFRYYDNTIQFDFISFEEYENQLAKIRNLELYSENMKMLNENRKEIKKLGTCLKDARRRSSDITEKEINIGIRITQLCPKDRDFYLRGLKIVFSPKRAERLLEK